MALLPVRKILASKIKTIDNKLNVSFLQANFFT